MISTVDTHVFWDILRPNPAFMEQSMALLNLASLEGPLLICEIVYAELAVHFNNRNNLDSFLDDFEVSVQPLGKEACCMASARWRLYRRAGGKQERILPDFLIGAHALKYGKRLLSRDRGFYKTYFSDLTVVSK